MGISDGLTPAQRRTEQLRIRISQAAVSLYRSKGYQETTVRDIADAADISVRTFFRHVGSREGAVFWIPANLDALVADTPPDADALSVVIATTRRLKLIYELPDGSWSATVTAVPELRQRYGAWLVEVADRIAECIATRSGVSLEEDPTPYVAARTAAGALFDLYGHAGIDAPVHTPRDILDRTARVWRDSEYGLDEPTSDRLASHQET